MVVGVDSLGIKNPSTIYKNLTYAELHEHEVKNNEGKIAKTKYGDVFTVDTGKFTGRSPKDKWIVKTPGSPLADQIWWGSVNQPITPEIFEDMFDQAIAHMDKKEELYVADLYTGANKSSRKAIRFVHEKAWQQHFVTNMFIRPTAEDPIKEEDIDVTIINACGATNEKVRSERKERGKRKR